EIGDNGNGTLIVAAGGAVTSAHASLGGAGGSGFANINAGGTWTVADTLIVGSPGASVLNVNGGAVSVGGQLTVNPASAVTVAAAGSLTVGSLYLANTPVTLVSDATTPG